VKALAGHEDRVRKALEDGLPCLGICLGMQLLFSGSEEGEGRGIGLVPGQVRRLRARTVPQMGWNDVEADAADPLFREMEPFTAYFANSFVCDPDDPDVVIAHSVYEEERFAAGVRRERTWGVQFHPEKSSAPGLHLLRNFLAEVAG
jgi:imidazole glycerol-phosphate synthase subunit HisH